MCLKIIKLNNEEEYTYTVISNKGRGSTCLCFDAIDKEGRHFLVKEFFLSRKLDANEKKAQKVHDIITKINDAYYKDKQTYLLDDCFIGYTKKENSIQYYQVFKYVPGKTIEQTKNLKRALEQYRDILTFFDIFHEQNLLFLDCHPNNIYRISLTDTKEILQVLDFDSVKTVDELSQDLYGNDPNRRLIYSSSEPWYNPDDFKMLASGGRYSPRQNFAKYSKALDLTASAHVLAYIICGNQDQQKPPKKEDLEKYLSQQDEGIRVALGDFFNKAFSTELCQRFCDASEMKDDINAIIDSFEESPQTIRGYKIKCLNQGENIEQWRREYRRSRDWEDNVSVSVQELIKDIDTTILPDIKCGDKVYSYSSQNGSPLKQALRDTDENLFIIGDAGIGKSTMLKMAYLQGIRDLNDNTAFWYFPLKKYGSLAGIANDLKDEMIGRFAKNSNKCIVFLDALDESRPVESSKQDWESTFFGKIPKLENVRYIISSRFAPKGIPADDYEKIYQNPLRDEQITQFLGADIYGQIQDKHSLHELISNSFMLTLFVIICNKNKEKAIGITNSATLLKTFFEEMSKEKVIKEGDLDRSGIDPFKLEDAIKIISQAAFSDCCLDTNAIDNSHVKGFLQVFNSVINKEEYKKFDWDSQQFITVPDCFQLNFSHEIYKEYFLAFYLNEYLRDVFDKDQLNLNGEMPLLKMRYSDNTIEMLRQMLSDNRSLINKIAEFCQKVIISLDKPDIKFLSKYWNYNFIKIFPPFLSGEINLSKFTYDLEGIPSKAFENCDRIREIILPDCIKYIGEKAFAKCINLERIIIPDSVIAIDTLAFAYCDLLSYIEVGESVIQIDDGAFYQCPSVTQIKFKIRNMQYKDKNKYSYRAFNCSPINKATVPTFLLGYVYEIAPQTLESIEVYQGSLGEEKYPLSFTEITEETNFKQLYICKDVESIAEDAFNVFKHKLESIIVEPGNRNFFSENNCLIDKDSKSVKLGCNASIIPKKPGLVSRISKLAFARCQDLENIVIPNNITEIGDHAFRKCLSLKNIRFGKGVKIIGDEAFEECINLKKVIVDDINAWSQIEFGPMRKTLSSNPLLMAEELECDQIVNGIMILSDEIDMISAGAFRRCKQIREIYIPSSIKIIGGCAFNGCDNINKVYTDSLLSWCKMCFESRSANPLWNKADYIINEETIVNLVVPECISKINAFCFAGCTSIETIEFLGKDIIICDAAFQECAALKKVIFHYPPKQIYNTAFIGCSDDLCIMGI